MHLYITHLSTLILCETTESLNQMLVTPIIYEPVTFLSHKQVLLAIKKSSITIFDSLLFSFLSILVFREFHNFD